MKNLIKNQNGFSIVQVLLGFAALGIASVLMLSMAETQNKTARMTDGKHEAQMMANIMNELLHDPNSCVASLLDAFESATDMTEEMVLNKLILAKRKADGTFDFTDFYHSGKSYGGLVKITSMKVRPEVPSDLTPGHKFVAQFEILGDVIGAKDMNRNFDFSFELTPTEAFPLYPFSCSAELAGSTIPRCRLCIQLSDNQCMSQEGPVNCSPWVNQANTKFWTNWTTDSDQYDPDCTKIALECQ